MVPAAEVRRWGCGHAFRFLTFKLLDLQHATDRLQSHPNFFATVAEAHLTALTTRKDAELRLAEKVRLVRRLYERGLSGDNIRKLFEVIDFLIRLAPDSARRFRRAHHQIEEEVHVRVLTQSEELAMEEGREEGRFAALVEFLEIKFGEVNAELTQRLANLDPSRKLEVRRAAFSSESWQAFLDAVVKAESGSDE